MTENAKHYELRQDDPDFGLKAGDILACVPYPHDRAKLTVAFRVSDLYNPSCNVYRAQVRRAPGETEIRWRDEPPYGAEPAVSQTEADLVARLKAYLTEVRLTTEMIDAVCKASVGEQWEQLPAMQQFQFREQYLIVLGSALRAGWTPPTAAGGQQ